MLSLWKPELPFWNDCFQEINKIALTQLNLLKEGQLKYINSTFENHKYNGSAILQEGSSTLYEYESTDASQIILFIPSLINKASILDLSKELSLILDVVGLGVKSYLLNWGEPEDAEKDYAIDSYIERLEKIIGFIVKKENRPILLAGYCMGGLFALVSSLSKTTQIQGLITIATPWNFDFPQFPKVDYKMLYNVMQGDEFFISKESIEMLFYFPHWMQINQKMIDFAKGRYDEESFLKIENWVNDGVKVTRKVLYECFMNLIQNNQLYKNLWSLKNKKIDPANLNIPSLIIMATKDNIVPIECAMALAEQIKSSEMLIMDCGHIGMIVNPKYHLAQKIVKWAKNIQLTTSSK